MSVFDRQTALLFVTASPSTAHCVNLSSCLSPYALLCAVLLFDELYACLRLSDVHAGVHMVVFFIEIISSNRIVDFSL